MSVKGIIRLAIGGFITFGVSLSTNSAHAVSSNATVTFFANPQQGQALVYQVSSTPAPLESFNSMGYSNYNHFFIGWNTSANGTGVQYSDGATYSFAADMSLYAQWEQDFHAVTFFENRSSSDSTISSQVGNSVTALTPEAGLTPTFSNPGFVFVDWNTASSGLGTTYQDSSSYDFAAPLSLYAQWAPIITFNPNGGSGSEPSITDVGSSTVTLPTGAALSRAHYNFTGWNTKADGSGSPFAGGSSFTASVPTALFAQWSPQNQSITFDPNGGVGVIPSESTPYGSSIVLPSPNSLTRSRYTFLGWANTPTALTPTYQSGQSFSPLTNTTLYAVWTRTIATVTFRSNDGRASPPSVNAAEGTTVVLPQSSVVVYPHHVLQGWSPSRHGPVTARAGQSVTVSGPSTWFAQWAPQSEAITFNEGGGRVIRRTVAWGALVVLPKVTPPHSGERLVGWRKAGGTSALLRVSTSLRARGPVTFVARYQRISVRPSRVRIQFDLEGARGRLAPVSVTEGTSWVIPSGVSLQRAGFRFLGWSSQLHSMRVDQPVGRRVVVRRSEVLHAVWLALPSISTVTEVAVIRAFPANSAYLSSRLTGAIARAAEEIVQSGSSRAQVFGFSTLADSSVLASSIATQRARATADQLRRDLVTLGDTYVVVTALGEGRITTPSLTTFRSSEIFAN